MNNKDGFVFYRAYYDVIRMIEDPASQLELLKAIIGYGLDGIQPELQYPLNAIFTPIASGCDSSARRYEEAKHGGKKGAKYGVRGGRPPVIISRAKAEEMYARLGSWKAVAKELQVADMTLFKARKRWSTEGDESGI